MSRDASNRIDTLEKFDVWVRPILSRWNLKPEELHLQPILSPIQEAIRAGITADNFWLVREMLRIRTGEYEPVQIGVEYPTEHFVHVSNDNPSMVAYTATNEHGRRDRQTRLSFGRYLKKTFPDWDDRRIRNYVSAYAIKYGPIELKFAETEDEIEAVYLNGPQSCMKHPANNFDSPFHPVRIYAGHGMRLAYLESSEGTILARTLVWGDTHGSVYGDADKMESALRMVGIHYGSLDGAKIQLQYDNNRIICPYIDEGYVDVGNNCLIIRNSGEYDAQFTDGYINPSAHCAHCDENYDEDELQYSEYHDADYCRYCRDNYYTMAVYNRNGEETWVHNNSVIEVDGEYYLNNERVLSAHCSELSNEYYTDTWTTCDTVNTHDGQIILADDAVLLYNETYAHSDEGLVELHDGRPALEDDPNVVETEDGDYALLTECAKTEDDSYILLPKGTRHEATA